MVSKWSSGLFPVYTSLSQDYEMFQKCLLGIYQRFQQCLNKLGA